MKKITLIILTLILISSCSFFWHKAPKDIQKNFTYVYTPQKTELRKLININGIYDYKYVSKRNKDNIINVKPKTYIMFFDDGLFIKGFYNPNRSNNGAIDVYDYIDRVVKNDELGKVSGFYYDFFWGNYIISDDTIKVQYVKRAMYGSTDRSWDAFEAWFKVIDSTSFVQVFEKRLDAPYKSEIEYYEKKIKARKYLPSKFIPLKKMPKPKGWVKKEKWFWANKDEYKKYMEQFKK